MKKTLLLTLLFALVTALAFSQTDRFWSANNESRNNIITYKAVARLTFPEEFKLFNLNIEPLRQELFSVADNRVRHSTRISLPNADGQIEQFEVFEASNFEPALQAQFPQIRAYSGQGITDKSATLKLSISPQGVNGTIFRAEKAYEIIEPYSQDHTVYAVFQSHRTAGQLPWVCSTQDQQLASDLGRQIANTYRPESNLGQLKTMRLAQSCNGEYSNYFGAFSAADVALVLAAFNTTLTRCNGCYEKDLAVHLNLIANTTAVIYYVPSTDPYTTLGNWNGQLQSTLTSIIGEPNYDIGHMFGASGGGGNAGCIGCVCVNGSKGSGITSPADGIPEGDNFDIDYVVHEVGHQMGGNHTFSFQLEGSGVNKEVGSGITIMGYAGITAQDDSSHSIAYYHEASIQQIQTNLATKTCPITTDITTTNATPVIVPLSNFTVPISTPFALTGVATDANPGDVLTYSWEQNDNSTTTGNNSMASPTKLTGPNWLSFNPTLSPTRLFPRLSTILTGGLTTPTLAGGTPGLNVEALSSVSRTLNFRLTVRDNCPYSSTPPLKIGQTSFADMQVIVTNTSGPFMVTQPNTNLSWPAASTQTVTWNVASTTGAPVSCANVNILLSTDGGYTFPTTLIANTPNDGTETVTLPNIGSTTARVKIESVGNIFFDISNTNFTITPAVSGFSFNTTTPTTITCGGPATATVSLGTTANGGFSTPIVLTATAGVPAAATVTFAPTPLTPGSATTVTLNNANNVPSGTYNITVTGTAGAVVQTAVVTFIVSPGTGPVISSQPVSATVCAGANVTFSVTATGVTGYQWQVNTGTSYADILGATAASYTATAVTGSQNGYLYHVVLTGLCNTTTSAAATLNVNTAPAITTQPVNTVACIGTNATFTVAATGAGLNYQWQSSPTGCGGTFSPIPAATSNSYTVTGITAGMDGSAYQVIITGTCAPAVTSNCVLLNVGNAAAITVQPVNTTVCEGSNGTISVTATGSVSSYQWQVNTGTGGFTDIPGANSSTLNLNAVTATMNGWQYLVNVYSCTAVPIVSSTVTLTVNTLATIGTQPANATVCLGANASFSVAATGTGIGYQWQYAPACGGTFTNIAGETGTTLNLNNVTLANAGAYQVVVTGTCNTATSTCVTLVVNSPITISAQPADADICLPINTASFSVTAAGTGLTYQWQVSTDGGASWNNLTGETAATLNLTGLDATMNGNQYQVVLNGTCTTNLNSASATLAVNSPVDITEQPSDVSSCAGSSAIFSVVATGSTITYQWQMSVNGGPFVDVSNVAPFSGATTSTLTVDPLTTTLDGYAFQVIVSGVPCGSVTSSPATLTVNTLPVVVLTAASFPAINPSIRTTLYTTVSPAGSYSYQWYKNGVLVPGQTSDRFDVTVDDLGVYEVVVTDNITGCSSGRSNTTEVNFVVSDQLFIYPNPSSGQFQVRYFSSNYNTTRGLSVYDSKRARVYKRSYDITSPYTKMDVHLDQGAAGIYLVEIRDANGKRLAAGKVVIR